MIKWLLVHLRQLYKTKRNAVEQSYEFNMTGETGFEC